MKWTEENPKKAAAIQLAMITPGILLPIYSNYRQGKKAREIRDWARKVHTEMHNSKFV